MARDVIMVHGLSQGENVDVEKRPKNAALRNSTCDFLIALIHGCLLTQSCLYLVIGFKATEHCARKSHPLEVC